MRIENRQPAAGGEPETAIRGALPAAACGIAGVTLGAAEAVAHPIVDGIEGFPFAGGEVRQLALGDAAYAARGAEPEGFAIVGDIGDVIAEQAVLLREPLKAAFAKRAQATSQRTDPQCSVGVLIEFADVIGRESGGHCVGADILILDAPETFIYRAGPQRAIAVFSQRGHTS